MSELFLSSFKIFKRTVSVLWLVLKPDGFLKYFVILMTLLNLHIRSAVFFMRCVLPFLAASGSVMMSNRSGSWILPCCWWTAAASNQPDSPLHASATASPLSFECKSCSNCIHNSYCSYLGDWKLQVRTAEDMMSCSCHLLIMFQISYQRSFHTHSRFMLEHG